MVERLKTLRASLDETKKKLEKGIRFDFLNRHEPHWSIPAPFSGCRAQPFDWQAFHSGDPFIPPQPLQEYAAYYGLSGYSWRPGIIRSGPYEIAAHSVKCGRTGAPTVAFAHGIGMHSGLMFRSLAFILDAGYDLLLIDLPGHGLSDGKRVDVEDFLVYHYALRSVLDAFRDHSDSELYALGHSTGCAAWLDVLRSGYAGIRRFVFLAPLVRTAVWHASKVGHRVLSPMISELPVGERDPMDDEGWKDLILRDPFRFKAFPAHWFRVLFEWNARIEPLSVSGASLTVLQGDRDPIVDWKYNVEWYRAHASGARIVLLPGYTHNLLMSGPAGIDRVRTETLRALS